MAHRTVRSALFLIGTLLVACGGKPAPEAAPPPVSVPPSSATAARVMRQGLIAALQADGDSAVTLLRQVRPTDLSAGAREIHACVVHRLGDRALPAPTLPDSFLGQVLGTYQEYWLRSLRKEHASDTNAAWLLARLDSVVRRNGGPHAPSMDSVETILRPMIHTRGYHALFGVTSPLRELMLWADETERRYEVALPQGVQPVTVVFMDRFASLGWAGFATCDRYHTGGWTKPDRLFAVRSAYDTASENFRVSYLAHEGQHFWDTQHLPTDAPAHRREYRAKLVELAVADGTAYDLLAQFAGNISSDTLVPHSYANGRVVDGMADALFPAVKPVPDWHTAPVEKINAAATALLKVDIDRQGH